MRKKWFGMILCLMLILVGCGQGNGQSAVREPAEAEVTETAAEASDTICLTIATSGNWEGILRGDLMEKYCRKINEWSDGHIIMKAYYNGVLGSDLEMIEAVQEGTLCIINSVPSYQITAVPEAALLDTPGVFSTVEEYNNFIEGPYFDTISSYYQKAGIKLLSSKAFTFREMTSNVPVETADDLNGLRLRTMENKYQVAFWQSMGATVSPMNFNETRVALQQGMISAQENPLGYMFSANLLDMQDHILLTNHVPMISNYLMNEEAFEQLSQEDQALVLRMLSEMEAELVEKQQQEEDEMRVSLESQGVTFTEASGDIRKKIREGRDVVLDMLRKDLGDSTVDSYMEAVEASKK